MMSPREAAFCRYAITAKSITQAAVQAKYSRRSAPQMASRLMKKVHIQKEIARLQALAGNAALIDRERILKEWNKIAFRSAKTIYGANDELKPMSQISDDDAMCIAEVAEIDTAFGRHRRLKFYSKEQALKELSKLGGLYPEEGTGEAKSILYVFGSEE
jgi:phage terminase small subunit